MRRIGEVAEAPVSDTQGGGARAKVRSDFELVAMRSEGDTQKSNQLASSGPVSVFSVACKVKVQTDLTSHTLSQKTGHPGISAVGES